MRRFLSLQALGVAAALVLAVVFVFDLTPWVRGGFGWRWEYRPLVRPIAGYALLLVLYVGLAGWVLARSTRPRVILLLAFAASAVFPVVAASLRDGDALYTLSARTFSNVASAQQWGAAQIDWAGGEWRQWTAVMARLGSHVATSPPALPLFYGLFGESIDRIGLSEPLARPLITALCADYRIYDLTLAEAASGWLGILAPLWAALTVFPMYSLARRLGVRAEQAVLFWPLVPALSAFAASSSTIFPLIAVVMFLPLARPPTWRTAAVSGLLFGIAIFVNFALLPLAAIAVFYLFIRRLQVTPRPPLRVFGLHLLIFAASGLIPWILWFVITGQTPLDVLGQALGVHLTLDRPYLFWSWFHVWDWAVWSGAVIAVVAIVTGIQLYRVRATTPAAAFALSLALTLVSLTLSGVTRGESGRIWLFLTPFLLIVASSNPISRRGWPRLALIQVLITVAMIFAIDAFNAPDVAPRPSLAAAAKNRTPLATFLSEDGGEFTVLAAGNPAPDVLELDIEGRVPTLSPVWFGVIVVDENGEIMASAPQQPLNGDARLPSTCWTHGSDVKVTLQLPALETLAGQNFYVSLSAFGFRDGSPQLTVITPEGSGVQVGLGPLRIAERD